MSHTRKGIADIPVIDCDKATNCGWILTSKELNRETSICDNRTVDFFSSSFSIFILECVFLSKCHCQIFMKHLA